MQVYDEIQMKWVCQKDSTVLYVTHIDGLNLYLGYTNCVDELQKCLFKREGLGLCEYFVTHDFIKTNTIFSKFHGKYIATNLLSDEEIVREKAYLGSGDFPYSFKYEYEACELLDKFTGKQDNSFLNKKISKWDILLRYTMGFEFETSRGYIPEDLCYKVGLIPLRDGSITGVEYSTIVMNSKTLGLLEKQIETLKEYTTFDKDCSLHIHLGGFAIEKEKIFRLYRLCYNLEYDLCNITPKLTFKTSEYKTTKKDYCKHLPNYSSFNDLYRAFAGSEYYGELYDPHPDDPNKEKKWCVKSRYFWANFINLICYENNKTIEFRFLRPTYNIKKILLWIYIFNAILAYAEDIELDIENVCLKKVILKIYPKKFASEIMKGITLLEIVKEIQDKEKDYIGNDIRIEDNVFNSEIINL